MKIENRKTTNRGGRASSAEIREKLDRVLNTSAGLFSRHGYAATSVENVAKTAGVSKPTIYFHYKSKANLLKCTIDYILRHRTRAIDLPILATDGEEALKEQLTNIIIASTSADFLGLFRIYLNESRRFPQIFNAFAPRLDAHGLLVRQLEQHACFRSLRYTREELAEQMLAPVGIMVTMAAIREGYLETISPETEADRIVDICLHGVMKT